MLFKNSYAFQDIPSSVQSAKRRKQFWIALNKSFSFARMRAFPDWMPPKHLVLIRQRKYFYWQIANCKSKKNFFIGKSRIANEEKMHTSNRASRTKFKDPFIDGKYGSTCTLFFSVTWENNDRGRGQKPSKLLIYRGSFRILFSALCTKSLGFIIRKVQGRQTERENQSTEGASRFYFWDVMCTTSPKFMIVCKRKSRTVLLDDRPTKSAR